MKGRRMDKYAGTFLAGSILAAVLYDNIFVALAGGVIAISVVKLLGYINKKWDEHEKSKEDS